MNENVISNQSIKTYSKGEVLDYKKRKGMAPIFINDCNHTYFDFHYHCPDVVSLFCFEQTIKNMEKHFENPPYSWEDIPNEPQHYDFYFLTEPTNISDLYEQLEYSFVEELAKEKNFNICGPPVNDQLH